MAKQADPSNERKLFFSLLDKFDVAMLVTHGDEKMLHARPMLIADREENGDIIFVSRANTQKVTEVKDDERVLATLQQPGKYLSISGHARLERDPAHLRRVWRERWRLWFPDGPNDSSLVLVRLTATEGDYWDYSGLQAVKHVFRTARAVLQRGRGKTPPDYHGHISLDVS